MEYLDLWGRICQAAALPALEMLVQQQQVPTVKYSAAQCPRRPAQVAHQNPSSSRTTPAYHLLLHSLLLCSCDTARLIHEIESCLDGDIARGLPGESPHPNPDATFVHPTWCQTEGKGQAPKHIIFPSSYTLPSLLGCEEWHILFDDKPDFQT